MLLECVSCNKEDVLTHDPRMLHCGHLICLKCIPKETVGRLIWCPKCSRDTVTPSSRQGQLDQSPLLTQLTTLLANAEKPCSKCGKPAHSKCTTTCFQILCTKCFKKPDRKCHHKEAKPITTHCMNHPDFLISEFCTKCSQLLCTKCTTDDTYTRCGTDDTCMRYKVAVKDFEQHCINQVPLKDLLAKKDKLATLEQEMALIENQVHEHTSEIIKLALKTEMVISEQLKQIKQAIIEQHDSANNLLRQNFKPVTPHQILTDDLGISLLLQKLHIQMLEAHVSIPMNKITFTKGSMKPSKLSVYGNNAFCNPTVPNRTLESIDSWEIDDVYDYVSPEGERVMPPRVLNSSQLSQKVILIQNESYACTDQSFNSGGLGVKNGAPNMIWNQNGLYLTADKPCHRANVRTFDIPINPVRVAYQEPAQKTPVKPRPPHKLLTPNKPPNKPPNKLPKKPPNNLSKQLQISCGASNMQVDPSPTPDLDLYFVKFAEEYNYVDEDLLNQHDQYTMIDWTYPPHELQNWTKDTSRILVTPDGKTILAYHTESTSKIWAFNDSGQQIREPESVYFRVLDMTYSILHKCVVLLDRNSLHYMNFDHVNGMSKKWKINIPDAAGDCSLLSCAILYKFVLVLYNKKGKLKIGLVNPTSKGCTECLPSSYLPIRSGHLEPYSQLQLKTDSKDNIYIINKEKHKIIIIQAGAKVQPILTIPEGTTSRPPTTPEPGIFLTCDGKVGYIESRSDGTFTFYWINAIKEAVHLAENTEQIFCVGHTGLNIRNKKPLFAFSS